MDLTDEELTEIIEKRWTPMELVEFLGLEVSDIVEQYSRHIRRNHLTAILEEVGYVEEDTSDND